LAGTLARVNSAEAEALDDGVIVNRTRQLILGQLGDNAASELFCRELEDVLGAGGKQVKKDTWHDPRLIIVHDVELPVPLYYFPAVVGDIETAYLQQAGDERRGYDLHTDKNWEKSLPNLNPRGSELTVDWSLKLLAKALVTRLITIEDDHTFVWHVDDLGNTYELGKNFATALYELSKINQKENLKKDMEERLHVAQLSFSKDSEKQRSLDVAEKLQNHFNAMTRSELRGEITREDILDKPILQALINALKKGTNMETKTSSYRQKSKLDLG
jgi:hypothetical protein